MSDMTPQEGTINEALKKDVNETHVDSSVSKKDTIDEDAIDEKKVKTDFQFQFSNQLPAWLAANNVSIGLTTYQIGKVFLVGKHPKKDALSIYERTFNQCMGLASSHDGEQLVMGSLFQLWRFSNAVPVAMREHSDYDKVYIPQVGYTTGNCDTHDVGFDKQGNIIFVNTLFSCLATTSERDSFIPLWKPPFISTLSPLDRCHLNGLAFRDGEPRYVTGFSQTDEKEGWRQAKQDGGFVMDIKTNETLAHGLSMPHSPRWHEGKLWVLNSGAGEFGYINLDTKTFEPIAFCPGYARGLCFQGSVALMGLSKPRGNDHFKSLLLEKRLVEKGLAPRCGLQWVDLKTKEVGYPLLMDKCIDEIYDVTLLPNTQRPMLLGFSGSEIHRVIAFDEKALDTKKAMTAMN